MPLCLDTRGKSTLGIAVCGRCGIKMSREDLYSDPNAPGLMVCKDDLDVLDPWRLPPRETENITMEWTRPDTPLVVGPMDVAINPLQAVLSVDGVDLVNTNNDAALAIALPVTPIQPSTIWAPNTNYQVGQQVTPINPVGPAAAMLDIFVYVCVTPGLSGAIPPIWPIGPSAQIRDNQVLWLNGGLYLP